MSKTFIISSLGCFGLIISLAGCQSTPILVSSPVSLDTITLADTDAIIALAGDPDLASIPGLDTWLESCAATMQPLIYPFAGYSYDVIKLSSAQDLQVSRFVFDAPQPVVSPHVRITLTGIVADSINEDSGADSYGFTIPKDNITSLNCAMVEQTDSERSATLTEYSIERRVPDPIYSAWLPTIRQHPKMNHIDNYGSTSDQWHWTNTDTTISVVALFIDPDTTPKATVAEVQFTVNRTNEEVMDLSVKEMPPSEDFGF